MNLWTLVLYAATNMMSSTDSVALTSVPNIESKQKCEESGRNATKMSDASYKTIKFICVPTVSVK